MFAVMHRRLDALGIRSPMARDALLGGVVATVSVGLFLVVMRFVSTDAVSTLDLGEQVSATAVQEVAVCAVLVAQSMTLTLRRRIPLACLALTLVGQLGVTLLLPPLLTYQTPATLVAVYSLGAHAPRRTALWGAAAAAVAQVALGYVAGGRGAAAALAATQLWSSLASTLAVYLGAAFVGAYVAARRELLAGLQTRVDQAEREREAIAARAVLEERGRMARELHDVAAHHLSGIVVQASAAERLVERDPGAAQESMRWIRAQGKETLDNLRLVVGILRGAADSGDGPATPQPTMADAAELIELARSTGADVHVVTRGEQWRLSPAAELTAYRVLQEALTNARRHAPTSPVDVLTEYGRHALTITVSNAIQHGSDGSTVAGNGIIGMSERARFVGGTLDVGPAPGGKWRVRLAIPSPPCDGTGRPGHAGKAPAGNEDAR